MTIDTMLHVAMEHYKQGQLPEAERICREILAQTPENSYALHLLGVIAGQVGRIEIAVQLIEKAVALHPGEAFFHCNLAKYCIDLGRFEQALTETQAALKLAPRVADSFYNMGIALQGLNRQDEAMGAYRTALEIKRDHAQAHANLANIYKDRGNIGQAMAHLRFAVRFGETLSVAHSNLVYCMLMHPEFNAAALRQELQAWNRQHAAALRPGVQQFPNDKNPDRPLRIGFVSPDFRGHVIGFNLLPLFQQHDKKQFAFHCYSGVISPDNVTEQFRGLSAAWRTTLGVSDDQVAKMIRDDQIDILVDLSLHLNGNRLLVFARKAAPVQATFAGYPGSTGLETMDYRLSDPYLDPPGASDADYCEKTILLPHSFWCYNAPSQEPPVNDLPAYAQSRITFGCLNNFCKVNDTTLRLWAKIMAQVPESRLILLSSQGEHRRQNFGLMMQQGIAAERIGFVETLPRSTYLSVYHQIDIGLDTLPYNGHTTSLDAFWMGVPVVTLVGRTVVGRAGYSQLMNLGLPELCAQTPEQYMQTVVELARDLPRLAELRKTLRSRLQQSPIGDAAGFTRGVEGAFRTMWRNWCGAGNA